MSLKDVSWSDLERAMSEAIGPLVSAEVTIEIRKLKMTTDAVGRFCGKETADVVLTVGASSVPHVKSIKA